MTESVRHDSNDSDEDVLTDDSDVNNHSTEASDAEEGGDEDCCDADDAKRAGGTEEAGTTPSRLLVISSKIKNGAVIQSAILPNVIFLQYKYENATLDSFLGLISSTLRGRRVESVAMVLHSSHSYIYLTGQDDASLHRNTVSENGPIRKFLTSLMKDHTTCGESTRLDILACNSVPTDVAEVMAKDLTSVIEVPVSISKDIMGSDIASTGLMKRSSKTLYVGELYFAPHKIRTWSGHIQTLAGFEKIRTVGKGAYGTAVLYRKKDDDSLVILKEINLHDLNVSERQLAQNEVRVLAMLDHPNIIGYYDSFEEDGTLMIEMEYADGGTLAQFLAQKEKPLEEREILTIFSQIVLAIKCIHEHNVLHRDLKTDNIFLTKDGVVKVGDFGISKLMSSANGGANTVLGTPYYISPEMCEGKPYDDKSDVWALGCILYEMACLQRTFDGSNLPALVNKIMKGQFAPIKGKYSQELKKLMMDMLQREPENRPSAADLWSVRLPQLMSLNDKLTLNNEEPDCSSDSSLRRQKTQKLRSVLFYFHMSSLQLIPVKLPWKLKICDVAVGSSHMIVVSLEHTVYAWGDGSKGQLGLGSFESASKPVLVASLKGKSVVKACCGDGFSIFASDNGIVMTSGDGLQGCLGHGDRAAVSKPRLIEALLSVNVVSIAAGPSHVAAVGSEGEVFVWGNGANGRLGLGNEQSYCQPVAVPFEEKVFVRKCWCGIDGTMLLTDGRSVLACGNNEHNKLGLNQRLGFLMSMKNMFNKCEVAEVKVFTTVKALARRRVIDVSLGPRHSCVIVEPGHVFTVGCNSEGQLGAGNTRPQTVPIEVKYFRQNPAKRIVCGDCNTVAATADNSLSIWGLRLKKPAPATEAPSPSNSLPGTGTGTGTGSGTGTMNSDANSSGYHSRQPSTAGVSSTGSIKDSACDTADSKSCELVAPSGDMTTGSAIARSLSFTALHQILGHSVSALPSKEKEGNCPESLDIIANPLPLLRMASPGVNGKGSAGEIPLTVTLTNIFRHGNNLFIQVETTAPPPRRHSRRKRQMRKRVTELTPSSREHSLSVSSHDGGDEYSSEASELDKSKTLPTWLKNELLDTEEEEAPKVESVDEPEEDASDRSDEESSLTLSIKVNHSLQQVSGKNPQSIGVSSDGTEDKPRKKTVSQDVCLGNEPHFTPILPDETDRPEVFSSSSSCEAMEVRSSKSYLASRSYSSSWSRPPTGPMRKMKPSYHVKSKPPAPNAEHRKLHRGTELKTNAEKEAKRRQDDLERLQEELKRLRLDKQKTEEKLRLMEKNQAAQRKLFLLETETKSSQRESELKGEITNLRLELERQSSELKDQYSVVLSLQEQLSRLQLEQEKANGQTDLPQSQRRTSQLSHSRESRVCVVQ